MDEEDATTIQLTERAQHVQLLQWYSQLVVSTKRFSLTPKRIAVRDQPISRRVDVFYKAVSIFTNPDLRGKKYIEMSSDKWIGTFTSTFTEDGAILIPMTSVRDLDPVPSLVDMCLKHVSVTLPVVPHVWVFNHHPFMERDCFRLLFEYFGVSLSIMSVERDPPFLFDTSLHTTWQEAYVAATQALLGYLNVYVLSCADMCMLGNGYEVGVARFLRVDLY